MNKAASGANSLTKQKKRVLVIDDLPDMRSAVRKMVESFGPHKVEICNNGDEAINMIGKAKYDIVLCDYNLGEGKDGQQVLEEVRHRATLSNASVFMMITAETTSEMVMGALEYTPDAYLVKPFAKEMLYHRLEQILNRKDALKDILKALDNKQYQAVLTSCQKHIDAADKNLAECLKYKGLSLIELGKYQEAKELYESVLEKRELPWAKLGLARALFFLKEYFEASEKFSEIIDENPTCLEAYDWAAKCQIELKNVEQAQEILENAVKLSPKAVLRQRALGEIAALNHDVGVSERAFKQTLKLGKNSCHRSPDDYLQYADVLVEKIKTDTGLGGKRAGNEVINILTEVGKLYPENNEVQLKSVLTKSEALVSLGRTEEAEKCVKQVEKITQERMGDLILDPYAGLKMIKMYVGAKNLDKAKDIANQLLQNYSEDEEFIEKLSEFADLLGIDACPQSKEEKEKLANLNKEGIKLFEEGKLQEAVELFESAAKDMPNNISVSLNAAQALIKFMQENGVEGEKQNRAKGYLDRVKNMRKEDKRYQRYQELSRMLKELK